MSAREKHKEVINNEIYHNIPALFAYNSVSATNANMLEVY